MGGRGTFAAGKTVDYVYKTVGKIYDVKVLEGIGGKHALPEESHSSNAYIKLRPDGTFHEMRIYGDNHEALLDIAYHIEPNFNRDYASPMTKEIYEKYSKYFVGVPKYDKW